MPPHPTIAAAEEVLVTTGADPETARRYAVSLHECGRLKSMLPEAK